MFEIEYQDIGKSAYKKIASFVADCFFESTPINVYFAYEQVAPNFRIKMHLLPHFCPHK